MPITIATRKPKGDYYETPYALLAEELAAYLGGLPRFSALRALADLDPYGEATLPSSVCEKLLLETRLLEELAMEERLPVPPEHVGLEGTGDPGVGEPFGWKGLAAFARALREVLESASSKGAEVVAIGD